MDKRYLTVVFEYCHGAALPGELLSAFKSDTGAYRDTRITAVSLEDEITRVERLEAETD